MNMNRAIEILGINSTKIPTQHMVRALGFHSWQNTPEENERREAGQYVLRRWKKYQAECNKRRDARFN